MLCSLKCRARHQAPAPQPKLDIKSSTNILNGSKIGHRTGITWLYTQQFILASPGYTLYSLYWPHLALYSIVFSGLTPGSIVGLPGRHCSISWLLLYRMIYHSLNSWIQTSSAEKYIFKLNFFNLFFFINLNKT